MNAHPSRVRFDSLRNTRQRIEMERRRGSAALSARPKLMLPTVPKSAGRRAGRCFGRPTARRRAEVPEA